ncbi:hypothetical protein CTEN210_01121 [Chaetoceros tenuissimus]|uniref:Uncharacterized protein n=1 Tax=Chaetoceros tenuissimus TaxID=426638 RepID=A0AAD3CEI1_9STRA|nr:hypothetical protein CTEN210_01121 [Chaetoceros tenuissimus]
MISFVLSFYSQFVSTAGVVKTSKDASFVIPRLADKKRQLLQEEPKGPKSYFNEQTKSDATVIVLSSLIPTHPSIHMINRTITSVRSKIHGLHGPKIIITVDGLPLRSTRRRKRNPVEDINQFEENIDRIEKYTDTLRKYFYNDPSVTILAHAKHLHISNNIQNALDYVDTKYVYIVQHDFEFIRQVNHTEIINAMENDPDVLRIVRFDKGNDIESVNHYHYRLKSNGCKVQKYQNESKFILAQWSDNNHITTKDYYREAFEMMGPTPRIVEHFFMANWRKLDCFYANQWLYKYEPGNPFLNHLDGRQTLSLSNSSSMATATG